MHSRVAGEFSKGLAAAMDALVVGPGLEPGTQVGPLINQAAVDKVSELVEGTIDGGARPLA